MANLKPEEYYKVGDIVPIRSSRLRFQETDSFDDKTGKDIPASVDFAGQNDRVIFLGMNKKGVVRIMTFRILNKDKTIAKPDEEIVSIENDMDFSPVDITAYVKKILGRKYEDILNTDPTAADQFITKQVTNGYNGDSKAYFVKSVEIIQTPWDPNTVPPQELKKVEPEKPAESPDTTPKVEETPVPSPVVETPVTQQPVRARGEYILEVVKPFPDTSKKTATDVPSDKTPTDGDANKKQDDATQQNQKSETVTKTTESNNGTKVAETKDVNTKTDPLQPGDPMVDSNGKPVNWDEEKPAAETNNLEAVLKVVGPNGNLVLFPDGTRRDIGELLVIKRENPYDPDILAIINESYDIPADEELDPEFTETEFTGVEADYALVEESQSITNFETEDQRDYDALFAKYSISSGGGGGGSGDGGGGRGSISEKLNFDPIKVAGKHHGKKRGVIKASGRSLEELTSMMFEFVEGGYYHPVHAYTKFSTKDRNTYGSSGETMWGLDRYAGQTEKSDAGKAIWTELDKLTGYGSYAATSRSTPTRNWDMKKYPLKAGGWTHCYVPPGKSAKKIYDAAVDYAIGNYKSLIKLNFKGNSNIVDLINSDNRMTFAWLRATWNGPGHFQKYAKNFKKIFDQIGKDNPEKLIVSDLNFRYSTGSGLIKGDASVIAIMIGASN
jgi:hypothetical protein